MKNSTRLNCYIVSAGLFSLCVIGLTFDSDFGTFMVASAAIGAVWGKLAFNYLNGDYLDS